MDAFVFLCKDGSPSNTAIPFSLLGYDAQRREGYLGKESTLDELGLARLKMWAPALQDFVAVELGEGGRRFKANTPETALRVTGPGLAGLQPGLSAAKEAVMRAHAAAKYVGHDASHTPVTVLKQGWLVTYAHGKHEEWELGTTVLVWLNNGSGDRRIPVSATVQYKSNAPRFDYVLLRVEGEWGERDTPVLDPGVTRFEPYVLVGASAPGDPHSTRHGSMLSTRLDENGHMKGDTPAAEGDSGGGCFLLSTGALFAICVACSDQQSSLLPITLPLAMAAELEAAEAAARQQQMPQQAGHG